MGLRGHSDIRAMVGPIGHDAERLSVQRPIEFDGAQYEASLIHTERIPSRRLREGTGGRTVNGTVAGSSTMTFLGRWGTVTVGSPGSCGSPACGRTVWRRSINAESAAAGGWWPNGWRNGVGTLARTSAMTIRRTGSPGCGGAWTVR
jgi:hypothetical protein